MQEYFSDYRIIARLARLRVRLASSRATTQHGVSRAAAALLTSLLPSRRQAHSCRLRQRAGLGRKICLERTWITATLRLRRKHPNLPWVPRLNAFIAQIHCRALGLARPAFFAPEVLLIAKEGKPGEYRAVTRFTLMDTILGSLAFQYLRERLDIAFDEASLAFRTPRKSQFDPRSAAVETILNYRESNPNAALWCADVDIKSFFDVVDHEVAWHCFTSVAQSAEVLRAAGPLPVQCQILVREFLASHQFKQTVANALQSRGDSKLGDNCVPWPMDSLKELHGGTIPQAIGIPQGGALSCLLVNCVLHTADQRVRAVINNNDCLYFRYCDDMILLGTRADIVQTGAEAYLSSLRELRLPSHPTKPVCPDSKGFWTAKTHSVFEWGMDDQTAAMPWISFLGYQIRRDGLLRVRLHSIAKLRQKIIAETDMFLRRLKIVEKQGATLDHRIQSFALYCYRLQAMTSGRLPFNNQPANSGSRKSWSNAYGLLRGRRFVHNQIMDLDRHLMRQIRRAARGCKLPFHPPNLTFRYVSSLFRSLLS